MPTTIDDYIAPLAPEVRVILQAIRQTIHAAAPAAEEVISYQIPAFKQQGMLVYFAAFKNHIGFYPPVRGDALLEKALGPYAGEKGNLRFPLDQPIPHALIDQIVKVRLAQNLANPAKVRGKPNDKSRVKAPAKRAGKAPKPSAAKLS